MGTAGLIFKFAEETWGFFQNKYSFILTFISPLGLPQNR